MLLFWFFFNFRKSVFQKLYDLYIEECEKEPEIKVSENFSADFQCCLNWQVQSRLFCVSFNSFIKEKSKDWWL